jgi:hypothetical protein
MVCATLKTLEATWRGIYVWFGDEATAFASR